jgi:hypothetical protein
MGNNFFKLIVALALLLAFSCERETEVCKTCVTVTTVFNEADTSTFCSEPFEACGDMLRIYDNHVTRIVKADSAENTLVSVTICDDPESN